MNGGCTVVIDPQGQVRYAIYKRFDSTGRQERQHGAMRGPLRSFWEQSGHRFTMRENLIYRLHGART